MGGLLKKYKIQPLKRLGQNFLTDRGAVKRVIEAANLQPDDIVLEIGPGMGALTRELAKKVKKVIAIEKDARMTEILKETLREFKNVKIILGDALKILYTKYKIPNTQYKVVANLPFYLTAPVIRKFLESTRVQPVQMVLMVQKEVGQRIVARPPDMNILAVSVQFYAMPKIISYISRKSFWPSPKVDSAIIRIAPLINADRKLINVDLFFRIVRAGFSQPRKQLINTLSKGLEIEREKVRTWLLKNNIQPSQRAETLSVGDWINLLQSCKIKL